MSNLSSMAMICAIGWEQSLLWELNQVSPDTKPYIVAPGVVQCQAIAALHHCDLVLARQYLPEVQELRGESVKQLTNAMLDHFQPALAHGGSPWTLRVSTPGFFTQDNDHYKALEPRLKLLENSLQQQIRHYWPKCAKRYIPLAQRNAIVQHETILYAQCMMMAKDHLYVSVHPTQRMASGRLIPIVLPAWQQVAQDSNAPCRSFYKLEEAWIEMNEAPQLGQQCVDLGAAPGGWTWSALKRQAKVIALDDAELASPVAKHPLCQHRRENGFSFAPEQPVDWLFCDMIAKPLASLGVLERWLSNHWCRGFVVAIKFRGQDVSTLLEAIYKVRDAYVMSKFAVRHLYFNHNEITVMGKTE